MYNVAFDCKCGMEQVVEVENGIETSVTCFNCNKEHVVQITAVVDSDEEDTDSEFPDQRDQEEDEDETY